MNHTLHAKRTALQPDIDALLWDSYLLVAELRSGAVSFDGQRVQSLCIEQVETLRERLREAGLSQAGIDRISFAQCALLDEVVLNHSQEQNRERWVCEPLQARFFGHHQGGEFLYEEMRQALAAPAPDLQVLTVFQRVLQLGFLGRYTSQDDPQRLQLLASLDERVAPMAVGSLISRPRAGHGLGLRDHVQRLPVQMLVAGLLLGGLWWGLDRWLTALVGRLLPALG